MILHVELEVPSVLVAPCQECGCADTEWHCSQYTNSGAADGRLSMHEVRTRFFLGCPACGETIRIVDGDDLAEMMTRFANRVRTHHD